MRPATTFLLTAFIAVAGCRVDGQDKESGSVLLHPSDEAVMAAAYDPAYSVPDDFFVDDRADTPGSYTIHHVKDMSLSYELCTDEMSAASALEDTDNQVRAVSGLLVEASGNERYFEFTRELTYPDSIGNVQDPTTPGFSRVFKCSYVNRDGVDRHVRSGYAGTLNVRPLSNSVVREFAEYLWQFTFFWPSRKAVIDTFSVERAESFDHTLTIVLVTNQGYDKCDLVEIVDWTFSADRESGEVTKSFDVVRRFEAEFVGGAPRRCGE